MIYSVSTFFKSNNITNEVIWGHDRSYERFCFLDYIWTQKSGHKIFFVFFFETFKNITQFREDIME